jgi:hypothetical protein
MCRVVADCRCGEPRSPLPRHFFRVSPSARAPNPKRAENSTRVAQPRERKESSGYLSWPNGGVERTETAQKACGTKTAMVTSLGGEEGRLQSATLRIANFSPRSRVLKLRVCGKARSTCQIGDSRQGEGGIVWIPRILHPISSIPIGILEISRQSPRGAAGNGIASYRIPEGCQPSASRQDVPSRRWIAPNHFPRNSPINGLGSAGRDCELHPVLGANCWHPSGMRWVSGITGGAPSGDRRLISGTPPG